MNVPMLDQSLAAARCLIGVPNGVAPPERTKYTDRGRTFSRVAAAEWRRLLNEALPRVNLLLLPTDETIANEVLTASFSLTHVQCGDTRTLTKAVPLGPAPTRALAAQWAHTKAVNAVARALLWQWDDDDESQGEPGHVEGHVEDDPVNLEDARRAARAKQGNIPDRNERGERETRKAVRAGVGLADATLRAAGVVIPPTEQEIEEAKQDAEAKRLAAEPTSIGPVADPEWMSDGVELESPPFASKDAAALAARGFERVNRDLPESPPVGATEPRTEILEPAGMSAAETPIDKIRTAAYIARDAKFSSLCMECLVGFNEATCPRCQPSQPASSPVLTDGGKGEAKPSEDSVSKAAPSPGQPSNGGLCDRAGGAPRINPPQGEATPPGHHSTSQRGEAAEPAPTVTGADRPADTGSGESTGGALRPVSDEGLAGSSDPAAPLGLSSADVVAGRAAYIEMMRGSHRHLDGPTLGQAARGAAMSALARMEPIGGPTWVACAKCGASFQNGGSWDYARRLCAGCGAEAAAKACLADPAFVAAIVKPPATTEPPSVVAGVPVDHVADQSDPTCYVCTCGHGSWRHYTGGHPCYDCECKALVRFSASAVVSPASVTTPGAGKCMNIDCGGPNIDTTRWTDSLGRGRVEYSCAACGTTWEVGPSPLTDPTPEQVSVVSRVAAGVEVSEEQRAANRKAKREAAPVTPKMGPAIPSSWEPGAAWLKCPVKKLRESIVERRCALCERVLKAREEVRVGLAPDSGDRPTKRRSGKPIGWAHVACVQAVREGRDPKGEAA